MVKKQGGQAMQKIVIPHGLQITMDDLGWFCGTDDRKQKGPARSGMPRRHCARDYEAVNELGRRLNMKINCAFIMGEWDPDNRLRKIPTLSKYGAEWNNAAYLDTEEAAKCVEVINASEYIDMAVHGLLHNCYEPGAGYGNSDYFYFKNGEYFPAREAHVIMRLEAYFDLLKYHGFNKKINSFIPPNFTYQWDWLARILKKYGIEYISTMFETMRNRPDIEIAAVDNGIITVDRNNNLIPWYEVASDPRVFPAVTGIFGCHWPNVLSMDPDGYGEVLDGWEAYFRTCSENFGIILSRDMAFFATQSVYKRFAQVHEENGRLTVDARKVPWAKGLKESFFISAREPLKAYTGCRAELYETHGEFINYRITPLEKIMTFE